MGALAPALLADGPARASRVISATSGAAKPLVGVSSTAALCAIALDSHATMVACVSSLLQVFGHSTTKATGNWLKQLLVNVSSWREFVFMYN